MQRGKGREKPGVATGGREGTRQGQPAGGAGSSVQAVWASGPGSTQMMSEV